MFSPSATLTFDTVSAERQRLLQCMATHPLDTLQIHLHHVTRCDSAGIALLIEAKRLCQQHKKACEFHGMPLFLQSLAEFCDVDVILRED